MYKQNNSNQKISDSIKDVTKIPTKDDFVTKVWVDFDLLNDLNRDNKMYNEIEIEKGKNSDLGERSLMYLKSSMDKDERIFKLQNLINTNKISTVQEASELLEVEINTIVNYLREIDKTLFDSSKNKQVGSTEDYKLSESKQLGKQSSKNYRPIFKYYDGNPNTTGKEITKDEHKKLIHDFKQKRIELIEKAL